METAPFFEDIAFGPAGGAAHWLTTDDGARIRVGHWPFADAKGTVLMFPGRTEYIEKYGDAAREMQAHGYASVAIDWRGQGIADRFLPERRLGHVGTFADYQKDVRAVMDHVRALGLPEPYYLVAHSMGGVRQPSRAPLAGAICLRPAKHSKLSCCASRSIQTH